MEKIDNNEIWKPVLCYEGKYEASDLGRIRSLNYRGNTGKTKVLKPTLSCGYLRLGLTKDGKTKKLTIHRLVFSAFNGPIPDGFVVDHVNNIKTDNRLENLQLLTPADNVRKSCKGKKLSAETRAKLSAAHKGKTPWLGKKHTEESKRKMSASRKGKRGKLHTEEAKAKMSAALKGKPSWMKGKKHTEETRAKMAAAQKARREREKNLSGITC